MKKAYKTFGFNFKQYSLMFKIFVEYEFMIIAIVLMKYLCCIFTDSCAEGLLTLQYRSAAFPALLRAHRVSTLLQ